MALYILREISQKYIYITSIYIVVLYSATTALQSELEFKRKIIRKIIESSSIIIVLVIFECYYLREISQYMYILYNCHIVLLYNAWLRMVTVGTCDRCSKFMMHHC